MPLPKEFDRTKNLIRGYHAPHETDAPILTVTNLTVRYENRLALDKVSFELNVGDQVAVVGPNGAGKSTLFKVVGGVHHLYEGNVRIFGHGPGGHTCIAYLPQRNRVDWKFPVSVADVVMMGRIGKIGFFNWPKTFDWDFVQECLEAVGLEDLKDRQISELSGGQQQRMFIAQALAQEAELMLMDEPLTGVDIQSQEGIFQVIDMLASREVTVLVSMHDLDLAASHFDQVLLLNRRLLGFGPPADVLTPGRLKAAYGSA